MEMLAGVVIGLLCGAGIGGALVALIASNAIAEVLRMERAYMSRIGDVERDLLNQTMRIRLDADAMRRDLNEVMDELEDEGADGP